MKFSLRRDIPMHIRSLNMGLITDMIPSNGGAVMPAGGNTAFSTGRTDTMKAGAYAL